MRFNNIIFDLDGTLTDPEKGISNSYRYACEKLDIPIPSKTELHSFIGPPLQEVFLKRLNIPDEKLNFAVTSFRDYFSNRGIYENEIYPGIIPLLRELKQKGSSLYVATSKLEEFAVTILDHFKLSLYIKGLKGADYIGRFAEKTSLISSLMSEHGIKPGNDAVMTGDRNFDIQGGRENGICTMAVTYGFGNMDEIRKIKPDYIVNNVNEMREILLRNGGKED